MADDSLNLQICDNQNIDCYIVTLLEKIDAIRTENVNSVENRAPVQVEIRTLEFWRAVICECLASFVYIFIVCGAAAGSGIGSSLASILLATSLSAGFVMTTLTQCFGHISGAHVNPAVSIAMGITKKVSVLRACMFVIAQCGGGIAGAAFLYGVTVPGYQGNLAVVVGHTANIAAWERFGTEFILTFVVVLTYFVSMESSRRWNNNGAVAIGASYAACTFASMPYLNPARSLGPSFVLNKWDTHWVYWLGPTIGGATSGLVFKYILNRQKSKHHKESTDGDSSSIHSDEDTYDDLDKPAVPKFHGSTCNTYRPSAGPTGLAPGSYCPSLTSTSLYSAPPTKLERVESLYGGTKSLYCKSPPLTRANLNRSQSVYAKSNSGINKDNTLPRPGPLVPAQSLYPIRFNQPSQSHVQNQNVQNQMQQRSDGIYGVRGVTVGRSDNYVSTRDSERSYNTRTVTGANSDCKYEENPKQRRPDSMYGTVGSQIRRGQPSQSDESYQRNTPSVNSTYNPPSSYPSKSSNTSNFNGRTIPGQEIRQSPPTQLISNSSSSSYHHNVPQPSPNAKYQ